MRLPAATRQQQLSEDSRAFHEQLWTAYRNAVDASVPEWAKIYVEAGDLGVAIHAKRWQDSRHRFWQSRGYRMRFKRAPNRQGTGFHVWLVPIEAREETAA